MKTYLLALLIAVCLIVPGLANWGSGDCGPVGPAGNFFAPAEYVWLPAPGGYTLWYGNVQIGACVVKDRAYFRLLPGPTWERGESPVQLPAGVCRCPDECVCPPNSCNCDPINCKCRKRQASLIEQLPKGGVETDKIRPGKRSINGRDCTKAELIAEVRKAAIPADQHLLRLVVIGSEARTTPILADLEKIPESKDFIVSTFPPNAWQVQDSGLAAGQPFSISVLTPSGAVLHRQSDYEGGISSLAEALRNAKDDYRADLSPDRRKSDPISALTKKIETVSGETWMLLGVAGFLLLKLYRKGN